MDITAVVEKFEKGIYAVLMILLIIVLVAAVLDLGWILIHAIVLNTPYLLEAHEMIYVLGGFLLVLIGVELLDTIKAYFRENVIHVEIVVLLAIIAVARKVILLDPSTSSTGVAITMNGFEFGFEMIGIGILLVCLAAGYFLIKKGGITIGPDGIKKNGE
ncbi:phosphate-starvation-inducible PsiE family protein [Methanoregula sp.]|uniref:phosphate-starvation-inducible PsiE family protein n=1 Tax=Methanoregula sp. TaxID=2052170 RepID=UPI000CBE3414|nr:phosphate-starvation-inducible PsiE family protein [Methanoregula sp.]PKG33373.1 MAG: hypothetical protein CW742_03260 [Methanoregula sp.]